MTPFDTAEPYETKGWDENDPVHLVVSYVDGTVWKDSMSYREFVGLYLKFIQKQGELGLIETVEYSS